MSDLQNQIREARESAGLSAREAASLVGVSTVMWQTRSTIIPFAHWELFLLKVGRHPTHIIKEK